MFIIIVLIVLALISIGGFVAMALAKRPADKAPALGVGIIGAVLTVVVFLITSFTTIGANEIGIQTTFGRADGVVQSGPHLLAPWSDVERFSTRVQVLDLSNKDGSLESPTVSIKFSGNSGGNVSTTTRWRIQNDEQAVELWRNYRTFDAVADQLVASSVRDALNVVFAKYTPEDGVNGQNREAINKQVVDELNRVLEDDGIVIDSVSLQGIDPDPGTQARIDRNIQVQADVVAAQSEQDLARIQNETNALRQASLTPQALTQTCLDIARAAVERGAPLPPTFNCGLGSSVPAVLPVG